ncbi:MAG: hypothetical protein AVO33_11165 [delta proteobacterium ML8_F1]|nr:MAG: hypothetical protein AVO33_11165 [delta proteobacterium ML8_F1]
MKNKRLRSKILSLLMLMALGLSGGWTYITYSRMPPLPVTRAVTLEAGADFQVTAQENLLVYPRGTVLPKDLAAYFYAADPQLVVFPSVDVSGLESGELSVDLDFKVRLLAADDRLGTYWTYDLEAIPGESFVLTPQKTTFTARGISLDAPGYYDLGVSIREEIDSNAGNLQLELLSTLQVTGTANGEKVVRQTRHTFDVMLQNTYFAIAVPPGDNVAQMTAVAASVPPTLRENFLRFAGIHYLLLALDGILLLGLVLSLVLRDRSASRAEAEHRRFKEWITEGTVEVRDKTPIRILTLEGLVDLAIDLDKRVIYDDQVKKYYVLEEDLLYSHDPREARGILDKKPQLGKLLLERGHIRQEQLETGLYYQQRIGSRLGESLIALGFINETTLHSTLAAQNQVNYVEVDPKIAGKDRSWLEKLDIKRARALNVLPLGKRPDGQWVIASGKPVTEELKKALEEIFESRVFLVATRPSAVFATLEYMGEEARQQWGGDLKGTGLTIQPYERLTQEENTAFTNAYYRGTLVRELLLKATGKVDPTALAPVSKGESVMDWLVDNDFVDLEFFNLMQGLERLIGRMDWDQRQEKMVPSMAEVLHESDYLTRDVVQWVAHESQLQKISEKDLLKNNLLASPTTLEKTQLLLTTHRSLLSLNPVEPDRDPLK